MRLWVKEGLEEIDEEEFVTTPPVTTKAPQTTTYPEHFRTRLQEEGRCFKCLGHGHRPGRCTLTKHLSYEEAKALLARETRENAVEKD